jgi:glucose-1-phosphate adenylyltransferase
MQLRVLAFVLAGGKGTRLYPLTKERAKPAVPFGGKYRICDFVLSNLINSGIYSIYVLIQFKSQSLLQHLRDGWQFGGLLRHQFVIPVPAQMRSPGETWYQGTADAIYQNINLIEQADPHIVVIFGADHIYRMNIREMIEYHEQKRADVSVAAIPVPKRHAIEFGVLETTADGAITGFIEKRADAPTIPGDPERVYASMGNYIFSTRLLLRLLVEVVAITLNRSRKPASAGFLHKRFQIKVYPVWVERHLRVDCADPFNPHRLVAAATYHQATEWLGAAI